MNTMLVYHFVDLDEGVEIYLGEVGVTKQEGIDFEIENRGRTEQLSDNTAFDKNKDSLPSRQLHVQS